MIIVLQPDVTDEQIDQVIAYLQQLGLGVHLSRGVQRTIVGAIGATDPDKQSAVEQLQAWAFVESVVAILKPYKAVSREFHPDRTVIDVRGVKIGGDELTMMAGPCTVESHAQLMATARAVKASGANVLRGGAFKPSTSTYSFQGLGEEGLKLLAEARDTFDLPVITEVLDPRDVERVARYADIFQVGTRNMANFELLKEIGNTKVPVMLKRGWASTIEEWLQAAEYIFSRGNFNVMLCERGIRTFETYTRNTFDVSAIPAVKELSHLPIIGDPSQGTGRWQLVPAVSRAAIAAGADGLIIEVHPNPAVALKDGKQSLTPSDFARLFSELRAIGDAIGRPFQRASGKA
jgi:3-deoxy-7-phosphoheptulonate synthase